MSPHHKARSGKEWEPIHAGTCLVHSRWRVDAAWQDRAGLIAGIGFIGGGAILKEGSTVRGTATAASIWSTGVVGAAVGMGRYEVAIALSLLTFLTLKVLWRFKQRIDRAGESEASDRQDRRA
jgi:uncharacterized membrane protein YhiD involved in acid resistance